MATINPANLDTAKNAAGKAAADLILPGMVVGLGTGSTAACFIDHLAARNKSENLRITAVATSEASAARAAEKGIPVSDISEISHIDITVDGADAIDTENRIIKGGGGAHAREKIVAAMTDQWVIIIDPSKQVERLNDTLLPIELLPFAFRSTIEKIEALGLSGSLRHEKNGAIFVTDNGNYIFDAKLDPSINDYEPLDAAIQLIPGVVDTGFFLDFSPTVIIGFPDGHAEIINSGS